MPAECFTAVSAAQAPGFPFFRAGCVAAQPPFQSFDHKLPLAFFRNALFQFLIRNGIQDGINLSGRVLCPPCRQRYQSRSRASTRGRPYENHTSHVDCNLELPTSDESKPTVAGPGKSDQDCTVEGCREMGKNGGALPREGSRNQPMGVGE